MFLTQHTTRWSNFSWITGFAADMFCKCVEWQSSLYVSVQLVVRTEKEGTASPPTAFSLFTSICWLLFKFIVWHCFHSPHLCWTSSLFLHFSLHLGVIIPSSAFPFMLFLIVVTSCLSSFFSPPSDKQTSFPAHLRWISDVICVAHHILLLLMIYTLSPIRA